MNCTVSGDELHCTILEVRRILKSIGLYVRYLYLRAVVCHLSLSASLVSCLAAFAG
jgi:hypothetical protein